MPRTETPPSRRVRHPGAPATGALEQAFDLAGLRALREAVKAYGNRLHLRQQQVTHLVMVAGELAVNAIAHGGGRGRLTAWWDGRHLYCRVADHGPGIADTGVGRVAPEVTAIHGRGIWMCRQVCTQVFIGRGVDGGATVTAVFDPGRPQPHGSPAHGGDRVWPGWGAGRRVG